MCRGRGGRGWRAGRRQGGGRAGGSVSGGVGRGGEDAGWDGVGTGVAGARMAAWRRGGEGVKRKEGGRVAGGTRGTEAAASAVDRVCGVVRCTVCVVRMPEQPVTTRRQAAGTGGGGGGGRQGQAAAEVEAAEKAKSDRRRRRQGRRRVSSSAGCRQVGALATAAPRLPGEAWAGRHRRRRREDTAVRTRLVLHAVHLAILLKHALQLPLAGVVLVVSHVHCSSGGGGGREVWRQRQRAGGQRRGHDDGRLGYTPQRQQQHYRRHQQKQQQRCSRSKEARWLGSGLARGRDPRHRRSRQ